MNAIPKGEGSFSNPRNHGGNSRSARLFVVALFLTVLLLSNCDWYGTLLDSSWILGYWVRSYSYAPYSDLLHFAEDGTRYRYEDYDGSTLIHTGTWSLNGSLLTIDGETASIIKISDNHYLYKGFLYYRKGAEPAGDIFDQIATELSDGVWESGSIPMQALKLYSYSTQIAGIDEEIRWDDYFDGSGLTTSDIIVSVYRADGNTPIFTEKDNAYDDPAHFSLVSGETIYIIVDAYWRGGSFRIKVN